MESIVQELRESGIDEHHIVYLDLDIRKYRKIKTSDQLESLIDEMTPNDGKTYLFIDEVQNVTDFETVSIGRIGTLECDFIFRHGDVNYAYVQVAMTIMADKTTEDREYAPLERIRDNYPKFVLTRNDPIQKRNGIIHGNLPDFMKQGRTFGVS